MKIRTIAHKLLTVMLMAIIGCSHLWVALVGLILVVTQGHLLPVSVIWIANLVMAIIVFPRLGESLDEEE